jgi:protein-disulfide isomerase
VKINLLIVLVLVLTVGMQGIILYKQHYGSRSSVAGARIRSAPPNTILDLQDAPTKGDDHARVVFVEFSDYECPYCQRHAETVGKQLEQSFVAAGKVKYAFINNPLLIHPNAKLLAIAAICTRQQNAFWQMHNELFAAKPKTRSELVHIAEKMGLKIDDFSECLDGASPAERTLVRDTKLSQNLGLTATPAFAIGELRSDGRVQLTTFIAGALPFEVFEKALNDALSGAARTYLR